MLCTTSKNDGCLHGAAGAGAGCESTEWNFGDEHGGQQGSDRHSGYWGEEHRSDCDAESGEGTLPAELVLLAVGWVLRAQLMRFSAYDTPYIGTETRSRDRATDGAAGVGRERREKEAVGRLIWRT